VEQVVLGDILDLLSKGARRFRKRERGMRARSVAVLPNSLQQLPEWKLFSTTSARS
jgi:hypothetical protein